LSQEIIYLQSFSDGDAMLFGSISAKGQFRLGAEASAAANLYAPAASDRFGEGRRCA